MSNVAYTSMHNKPCISTPNCQGKYIYLEVVQEDNETKVKVRCNVCSTQIDRYIPA
jgi:hypothetical protein